MKSADEFERLQRLFHELDGMSVDLREARLQALSGSEPALHAELLALFEGSLGQTLRERELDGLAGAARGLIGELPTIRDPEVIGPYRLLRPLGEGGMGRVYLAEQQQPVTRTVALKLTRHGFDSQQTMARFRAERQALAVLDHPGIAKVFDAGTLDDGRPWFAMEFIDGVPITLWASQRELDLRQRIELLIPVCEAVQHAHLKGMIHRDLKPSNILVIDDNGVGQPKVIDFGIAKSTDLPVEQRSFATAMGELVGTPEYMSPEQASLGEIDVDTRSDVYALGLVLYELLVGALPIDAATLRKLGFIAMCRQIRETDTPRPSIAVQNHQSPSTLRWRDKLSGDLDSVVLKALAKDREQRYGSAAALAEDLHRYLDDQPVLAQPPSLRYRSRKFLRRHRLPVMAAALIALLLAASAIVANHARLEARRAEARALESAEQAVQARAVAESTASFMVELFTAADPRYNPGLELTARELLQRGEERIDRLADTPAVQARLLESLGDVYWSLGAYDQAEPLLERGIELRRQPGLSDPRRLSTLLDRLAGLKRDREQLDAAEALYRESLRVLDEAELGASLLASRGLNNLGIVLRRSGKLDEAAQSYARALAINESLPEDGPDTSPVTRARMANLRANLGTLHHARGDFLAAHQATSDAMIMALRDLPTEHPYIGGLYANLSSTSLRLGELDRALLEIERSIDIERASLGADHPSLADSIITRGQILSRIGQLERAARAYDEARQILRSSLGDDNTRTLRVRWEQALLHLRKGEFEEARHGFTEVSDLHARTPSTAPATIAASLRYLALCHRALGDIGSALTLAEQARQSAATGDSRSEQALATLLLGLLALDQNQTELGRQRYREALTLADCGQGPCTLLDQADKSLLRAHWLAASGDNSAALDALAAAIAEPGWTGWMLEAAEFLPLQPSPRWQALRSSLFARSTHLPLSE